MGIGSLSSIATPVAVGIGVIVIGVLLLIRERRTNSASAEAEPRLSSTSMTHSPSQNADTSSARALLDALDEVLEDQREGMDHEALLSLENFNKFLAEQ